MEYKHFHDTFYDTGKLTLDEKRSICQEISDFDEEAWHVDVLGRNSFRREEINMAWDEIMRKLDENCHFSFIHRRGYENWKENSMFPNRWRLEVGFKTREDEPHFLWLWCNEEHIEGFVAKYDLKPLHDNIAG